MVVPDAADEVPLIAPAQLEPKAAPLFGLVMLTAIVVNATVPGVDCQLPSSAVTE
jgi:multisubunit Na+/H+ antiporter MnhC subunit